MLRFSANLSMLFGEYDFLARFEKAAQCGFRGVEFMFPYDYDIEELKQVLASNKLEHTLHNLPAGDWAAGVEGPFDLILCNPPYIEDGAELMPDVADHEPAGALFGGPDGLDCYRLLLPEMPRLLAPGGVALFEFGLGQGPVLVEMAAGLGMAATLANDLTGRARVLRIAAD